MTNEPFKIEKLEYGDTIFETCTHPDWCDSVKIWPKDDMGTNPEKIPYVNLKDVFEFIMNLPIRDYKDIANFPLDGLNKQLITWNQKQKEIGKLEEKNSRGWTRTPGE